MRHQGDALERKCPWGHIANPSAGERARYDSGVSTQPATLTVDRTARDGLAEALRQFIAGRHTNFEFEDLVDQAAGDSMDSAVSAVRSRAWFLYDDLRQHRRSDGWEVSEEGKREISRWIVFLHTDLPYEWSIDNFASPARWLMVLLTAVGLTLAALAVFEHLALSAGLASTVVVAWACWWGVTRSRERRFEAEGEPEVWPFLRREDCEAALDAPRLLSGGRN